jgi:hypothetical protein
MRKTAFCLASFVLAGLSPSAFAQKVDVKKPTVDANIVWVDILTLGVEGQGWQDTKAPFDRLPARAEGMVRDPVWNLSRNSAGLAVRFVTAADSIHARWTLTSAKLEMTHMPATGVSGVDLYVKHDGQWRWLAVGQPKAQSNSVKLVGPLPKGTREFLLYLPLYNGVSAVEIGTPKEQAISKAPAYPAGHEKPVVFYGTSITQGGCASRPGMVHTAILGRWLNRPVINLGFSGNGRMEPEMAKLFAELDPAVFVLDCLPNMTGKEVAERVEPFVHTLRKARPKTPILLVEDRSYTNAYLVATTRQRNDDSRAALKAAYQNLQKAGVGQLSYLAGADLLGADSEGTVDGSHPSDLGFYRQAEVMVKPLREILAK